MMQALTELALFAAKGFIIFSFVASILILFFILLAKSKQKIKGKLIIKNINQKYEEITQSLMSEILPKKSFKQFLKEKKAKLKIKATSTEKVKNIFILNFHGDIKASGTTNLSEEITALLTIATPHDEVVLRLESAGGIVHGYGLAAAQLMRIRAKKIPLIITIDKIAASGGYMMACIANKILAAPFAIIGSIGVIVQLPNFHRLLKEKHIDFEQLTAGEYKRTLTMFGHNTEEGREKLQHEIEDMHGLFKHLITDYRPDINIEKVATGEHWLGQQALTLNLIDEIKTSDDYLFEQSKKAHLYEICYETKPSFFAKLTSTGSWIREKLIHFSPYQT